MSSVNKVWQIIIRSIEILVPVYDFGSDIVGFFSPRILRYLTSKLYIPRKLALDIGIGTGLLSKKILSGSNTYLIGVDVSFNLAFISKLRLSDWRERIDVVVSQAEKLPFRNKSIESVYMAFTYRDLINHILTIFEINRVLRFRGIWIIADIGKPDNRIFRLLLLFIMKYISRILGKLIYPSVKINPWKTLYLTYQRIYPNEVTHRIMKKIFNDVKEIGFLGGMAYIMICVNK